MNVIASQTTVIRLLVRKNNEKQCSVPLTYCNVTWGFAPRNASLIFREGIQQTWHRWIALQMAHISELVSTCTCMGWHQRHIEGILPKVPYLPCVSMAGRALLAGYHRYIHVIPLVPKQLFIRPFEKRTYYAVAMSVRPSVCPSVRLSVRPSVRPRFTDFSSTCFEISIWNLVYTFSRWHDISSSSCITIGSLWPSLQPKVGQTHFFAIIAS